MLIRILFLSSHVIERHFNNLLYAIKLFWYYILSFPTFYKRPRIINFYSSEQILIKGGILKLTWKTRYASLVKIKGLGYYYKQNEIAIPIDFKERTFRLIAYGFLTRNTRIITVKAMDNLKEYNPNLSNNTPAIFNYMMSIQQPAISIASVFNTAFTIKNIPIKIKNSISHIHIPKQLN